METWQDVAAMTRLPTRLTVYRHTLAPVVIELDPDATLRALRDSLKAQLQAADPRCRFSWRYVWRRYGLKHRRRVVRLCADLDVPLSHLGLIGECEAEMVPLVPGAP